MKEAFICEGIRTPIGRFGGVLSSIRTDDLAALPLKKLKDDLKDVDWESIDEIFFGNANQAGEDNRNIARMALLLADFPESIPGITLNRLCASGMEAVDHIWFENLNLSKLNYWYSLIVESLEFNDIMKKYKVWESSDSPLITNFIT
mgnify:CR=1 FL=1